MLDEFTGDILGLVLSFCPISDYKSVSLYSRSCYETHFSDPNSSAFTEWLLQIIAKSSEKKERNGDQQMIMTREMWNEIEKFKPYVWKQLSRRKLIPKETTVDQISSLNCLQVISFMNNNWLEMKNLFFSSDFYTFQASSCIPKLNGIVSVDLEMVDDIHSTMMQNEGITIEAWISIPHEWSASRNQTILSLKNKGSSHGMSLCVYGNRNIGLKIGDKEFKCNSPFTAFEWIHVAGVYDMKANECQLYINGKPSLALVQLNGGTLDFEKNNMELVIGSSSDLSSMRGEFTDLRVWNVARSEKQIKQSMGRRIFVYHFENTQDMNYLVFNCYPDPKMDTGNIILNKSPNFRYRTEPFNLQSHIDFLGGPIQSRLFNESLKIAKFKI